MTRIEVMCDMTRIADVLEQFLTGRDAIHVPHLSNHHIHIWLDTNGSNELHFDDIQCAAPQLYADLMAAFQKELDRVRAIADFAGIKEEEQA